ncbi:hypothetical protein ABTX57_11570, partial [Streptomyces sp. NPDC126522]
MTVRATWPTRVAASVLGVGRPGRIPPTVQQQRDLPLRRRLLASVLGIRVRPAHTQPTSPPTVTLPPAELVNQIREDSPPDDRLDDTPSPAKHLPPAGGSRPRPTDTGGRTNSLPQHLHSEDRQEYERILDEALRSAPTRPELAA